MFLWFLAGEQVPGEAVADAGATGDDNRRSRSSEDRQRETASVLAIRPPPWGRTPRSDRDSRRGLVGA